MMICDVCSGSNGGVLTGALLSENTANVLSMSEQQAQPPAAAAVDTDLQDRHYTNMDADWQRQFTQR